MNPANWRLSLSRQFAALAVLLVTVGMLAVWAIETAVTRLDGTAAQVNLAGSLRWMTRDTQLELRRMLLGLSRDSEAAQLRLDQLASHLATLEHGGRFVGFEVPALPAALHPQLAELKSRVSGLRELATYLLAGAEAGVDREGKFANLQRSVDAAFAAADSLTASLAAAVEAIHREIRYTLFAAGALVALILAAAMFGLRRRVVRPLQDLAETTRAFAAGRRQERVAIESADEIGKLARSFNGMADEIAGQMHALESAHVELRKLSSAIEYSPASVMITDAQGIIEYVNPRFTVFSGYAQEEVLGRTPAMMLSGVTDPEVYRGLWKTLSAGYAWRGRFLNRRKSGDVYWEDTWIAPIRDDAGQISHYVAVKEDVTEHVRLEEEKARLHQELERRVEDRTRELSATVRELETFSYTVSHDLRAPLRAISSFAQLMDPHCKECEEPEAYSYLQRIQTTSARMGEIIEDLLELARISRNEVKRAPVDLTAVARAVIAQLADAPPRRGLAAFVQDGITVSADPGMLRLVLENLLGNAWKFTAGRTPASIRVTAQRGAAETVIAVADNGVGFDMRYADKLFRPFERLHGVEEFEGSGIGLTTVARIVHLHGGRVWAEGKPGEGACFYFSLPDEARALGPAV